MEAQPWLDPDPVPKETHFSYKDDYDPQTPFNAAPNSLLLKTSTSGLYRRPASKLEEVPSRTYQV